MSQIGVSYTPSGGSPVYNFVFDNFGDNALPRSYQGSATFTQSANGASIIAGPAFRQKYMWAFASIVTKEEAALFDEMFQAWDADRSAGIPAAVGVTDETFGPSVSASAVITTPPTYNRMGPRLMLVAFSLTEV
jgi:hypothetical protein